MNETKQENTSRQIFQSIFVELTKVTVNTENIHEYINRLEKLYSNGFRHFYSDIAFIVMSADSDKERSAEKLLRNLSVLRMNYAPPKSENNEGHVDISKNIRKLYDHVNLELVRMSYVNRQDRDILGIEGLQKLHNETQRIAENQRNLKRKIEAQQREYVAILGIFAAIIITVIGGLSFTFSAFGNLGKTDIFQLTVIILVTGLVFDNLIYGLFIYIESIVKNEKRTLKPLIVSDIVLAISIIAICIVGIILK